MRLKWWFQAFDPNGAKLLPTTKNASSHPRKAIQAGADLIVVGRPIRDSINPKDSACKIVAEIEESVKQ